MASIRSVSTLSSASRTTSTLSPPSGLADGDILVGVIIAGGSSAPAVTGPSGWTEVTTTGWPIQYGKPDPWYVKIHLFWKLAASESGDYSFTHSSAYTEAIIYAVVGANTTTPVYPNPTAATGIDTQSIAPSITPETDDAVILWVGACWDAAGPTSPPSGTTPTFSEDYDPGTGGVFYAASGVLSTAQATGAKTVTNHNTDTGDNSPWGCGLVCIQSAPPAGTLAQHSFRFFNDDGSESGSTAKDALNTNVTLAANDVARLRFLLDATGDPDGKAFKLEYRRKPSGGSFGDWGPVN